MIVMVDRKWLKYQFLMAFTIIISGLWSGLSGQTISLSQTVSGRVVDSDSKIPLIGASVVLGDEPSVKGTMTNEDGYFVLENVPVGRHKLRFSYVGYEPKSITEFLVSSGKESVITVELVESIIGLSEIEIIPDKSSSRTVNDLTTISGRSFSAVEIENYPGSMSDISRTALSFPGVMSTNDGKNHIVIRGNSPKGLQWRLEGIEIPNLNHFSGLGASGGGVGIISNNMIATSDFITSAFPIGIWQCIVGCF